MPRPARSLADAARPTPFAILALRMERPRGSRTTWRSSRRHGSRGSRSWTSAIRRRSSSTARMRSTSTPTTRRPTSRSPSTTPAAPQGFGLTFTTGRGTEVVVAAVEALRPVVLGRSLGRAPGRHRRALPRPDRGDAAALDRAREGRAPPRASRPSSTPPGTCSRASRASRSGGTSPTSSPTRSSRPSTSTTSRTR